MTEIDELEDLIEASANTGKIKAKTYGNTDTNLGDNQPTHHKNFFKKIFITLSIILVVLLIAFVFWPRRPPRSPYLPIPYIFNYNFKKTVLHYISLPSRNQILVITGPPGIGKTRGLNEISKKFLNNSKYLPISFDFVKITQHSSSKDIKDFLLTSILKAFHTIDSKQVNLTEVKKFSPFLDTIHMHNFQMSHMFLKEPILNKIFIVLNQTLKEGSESEYQQFFYLLDKFSNFLNIIIIANDPFRFYPFINFCHKYSSNTMKMGIIFDIDNIYQTDVLVNRNTKDKSIYRLFFLSEFDEKSAKNILVDKEYVFTKKIFPKLWDLFGGKGIYWAQFHDAIREGYGLNDAISMIQNQLATKFIHATSVGATRRVYYNRVSFLKKIIRKSENTIILDDIPIIEHYNEWGLLAPSGPNKIILTDKILISSIKKALKSL
ncbi:hypothetical protein M9Y10_029251 [Tritrichomonas musculus]|uniref:ATPase AAA-type core domain-containing protein n=1 Tax=Tritrichomonas musculus TaxID=1915356 RepID=A0ABR2KLL5_9EUKA